MKKFLFVKTSGNTIDQAILNMHEALMKINGDPDAANLEIHSVNFAPSVEMPAKTSIMSATAQQPVMVNNCIVLLVEKLNQQALLDKYEELVNKLIPEESETDPTQPTEQQKKAILSAARFFCQHTNLMPAKHSRAHRSEGTYYQICADCGAEVWQGVKGSEIPVVQVVGEMKVVPHDPIGDAMDERFKE